jgi:flagellar basal-body rod protein FlgC
MGINKVSAIDIAVSGLRAQSARLNVISNNIANASTTKGADGKPYRRQEVVLGTGGDMEGVKILRIQKDASGDPERTYEPGNPEADKDGYVMSPNVDLPVEMMHMVTASRAYQANVAMLKRYQENMDVTAELLK